MNGTLKSGNAACDTLAAALKPLVALVDGLVSRVDKLTAEVATERLRNDRLRDDLLAADQALRGAMTLVADGHRPAP